MSNAPAQTAAQQQAAARQARAAANATFMKYSIRKRVVCPPASGAGTTQTYAFSTLLPYVVPTANGAFCEGIEVRASVPFAFAAGTAAVYQVGPAGVLAMFDNITVLYNGTLHKFRPYILALLRKTKGRIYPTWPDAVLGSGSTVTARNTYIGGAQAVTANTTNTWTVNFYVPFNLLGITDFRGLLPMMGGATSIQVQVQTATALFGADPILNAVVVTSGTGHAITVTGTATVQLIAYYRDGTNYNVPKRYVLQPAGFPVPQLIMDIPLNNVTRAPFRSARSIRGT
jgi:hypothetical protein